MILEYEKGGVAGHIIEPRDIIEPREINLNHFIVVLCVHNNYFLPRAARTQPNVQSYFDSRIFIACPEAKLLLFPGGLDLVP